MTKPVAPAFEAKPVNKPTVRLHKQRRLLAAKRLSVLALLLAITVALYAFSLMYGETWYSLGEVVDVALGKVVPGASFTVGELRLPRASLALLVGLAFGISGVTMQTLLRNPLASPDIVGISSGASAGAVFAVVFFPLPEGGVALFALLSALATALLIYALSYRAGFSATRLVLIGIGIGAMLKSLITYALSRASSWDMQAAMRWINGSLNTAQWADVFPLAFLSIVLLPLMIFLGRELDMLRLGDDLASSLGVRMKLARTGALLISVTLLAVATSASGPINFVPFMAGPIAARLMPAGSRLIVPAGLVGAIVTMTCDLLGQFIFPTKLPVGVITGALGAPYLIYLLIRSNRAGGSL